MRKTYYDWEQDEAYRDGYRDASHGRDDMSRPPKFAADFFSPDRAYWEGHDDYLKEQERKRRNEENWDNEYERWRRGE